MQANKDVFKSSIVDSFLEMSVNAYVINADHVLLYCNHHQAIALGHNNPKDIVGKNLYEMHPIDEAEKLANNNALVLKTGEEHIFEEQLTIPGKQKVFSSQKRPFYVEGKLLGVMGFSIDITEQKAYEKQLKAAKETAESILGNSITSLASLNQKITGETSITSTSPEGYLLRIKNYFERLLAAIPIHLYWIDRNGVYMGCSDLQAKSIGLKSTNEIVGKTNAELHLNYNGAKPEILDQVNEEVMSAGVFKTLEESELSSDGTIATYLSTKTPLFDEKGNVIGLLGASIDITAQKEAEELRVAKERSEAADQIKTDYLANVFHDVRTPINWINGAIDTLKVGGLEDWEIERKYDLMDQASNMIIRLLDDISDVAKVENNELLIKPTTIDLSSLIRSLEEQVIFYKQEDTVIQIDTFFDVDDPYFVKVDGVRLFQVLLNLLTNACKSITGRGFVTLECNLKEDRLCFSVKDNGMGIREEKLKSIFDRFVKINQHVTGKGIGLSISQRIVQLMGDDIKVESKLGEGSTFSFSVPFIPKDDSVAKKPTQKIEKPNWKDKTILIVEDIKENFDLLETILRPTNCKIIHASNGKKAIEFFNQNPAINLVLLDLGLPDILGEEVLKNLKEEREEIPVVVQTAYAVAAKKDKLIKAGASGFVTKPIRVKALIDAMTEALKSEAASKQ